MFIIAINTIKEFIRNKILYIILFLSIWLIFLSLVLSTLALSEWKKIILDFSLSVIEVFWLITTLFLWAYLIYSEIVKNTILLILSKNPLRNKFILWKFIWFSAIIFILYFVLTLAFIWVLYIHNIWFEIYYIIAILFSYIKLIVTLSILIFFSTFMSPFLSLLVTLLIYVVSHTLSFVKYYSLASKKIAEDSIARYWIDLMYYIFPNFQDLSIKEYLMSPDLWLYNFSHIWMTLVANVVYIALLLIFAIMIFNKREF